MTAAAGDAALQLWGCQQLMRIGFNGNYRSMIGQQSGVDAIVRAMESFPRDERIQEAGTGALWVLAFHRKSDCFTKAVYCISV